LKPQHLIYSGAPITGRKNESFREGKTVPQQAYLSSKLVSYLPKQYFSFMQLCSSI